MKASEAEEKLLQLWNAAMDACEGHGKSFMWQKKNGIVGELIELLTEIKNQK